MLFGAIFERFNFGAKSGLFGCVECGGGYERGCRDGYHFVFPVPMGAFAHGSGNVFACGFDAIGEHVCAQASRDGYQRCQGNVHTFHKKLPV